MPESSPSSLPAGTQDRSGRATVVFTACSANYLAKALAMCRSVLDHNSGMDVVILVVDRKRDVALRDARVRIVWVEDIGFPGLLRCAFKYNIIELNTALKPWAAQYLLAEYRKVIYLDPDICVFSSLASVDDELERWSVLLTPHALSPYDGPGRPDDQDLLRFGAFNLGFFAVNRSAPSRAMLSWWHRQCLSLCFYDPPSGLGVDQKWMDLAPSFFDGVRIVKDPGLNVAFWNLHERRLARDSDGWLVNGTHRLHFVHFSSFAEDDTTAVAQKQTRYEPGARPDFSAVADVYRTYLREAADGVALETAYGFSTFDGGQTISPLLRRMFALHERELLADGDDPFASTGPVFRFARRHHLLSTAKPATAHVNFKAAKDHAKSQRFMATLFRIVLRVVGPDRYFLLMRFLGHYSSTLNQLDLLGP